MSKSINDLIEYKRGMLKGLLSQLPTGHVTKFKRIYGSIDVIDPDKIERAILLCERALNNLKERRKNND